MTGKTFSAKLNIAFVGSELGTLAGLDAVPKKSAWNSPDKKKRPLTALPTPPKGSSRRAQSAKRIRSPKGRKTILPITASFVLRTTSLTPVRETSADLYSSLYQVSEAYDKVSSNVNMNVDDMETLFRTILIQPACIESEVFTQNFKGMCDSIHIFCF